jgi:hypothetical protein
MGKRFLVICLSFCLIVSCTIHKTEKVEVDPQTARTGQLHLDEGETIAGVTTRSGKVVDFPEGGSIRDNAVHAPSYSIQDRLYDTPYAVSLDEIERLWVGREVTDGAASAFATIGVIVATLVVAGAIGLAIVAATKDSCPFVYSWDGQQFVFDAEPYGGATSRGLTRSDYAELEHLVPWDGFYEVMITNEVRETQYTDLLELWVVDHPRGTRVVADEWGGLFTLGAEQSLQEAVDASGADILPWLVARDRLIWEPLPVPGPDGALYHELILTFSRPVSAREGLLIANVATGMWGSHMIREMLQLHGRNIDQWYAAIDDNPVMRDALLAWNLQEELYGMKIEVEEPTGWEVRGYLPGGGPYIAEDRAVRLDLSRVEGNQVRIRLQPPAGFWAFNTFTMDCTGAKPISARKVAPVEARTSEGEDVLPSLLAIDGKYYEMPETGDRAWVKFPEVEEEKEMERTIFLNSCGYYLLHLPPGGEPDLETLAKLRDPGGAVRFAMERYREQVLRTGTED